MKIAVFANTVHTATLTGGDKIFAQCAKRWIAWGHKVTIVTNEVGKSFCVDQGVPTGNILVWSASWTDRFGVYFAMSAKAVIASLRAFVFMFRRVDVVFASSFFVPDMLPGFLLKLTNPRAALSVASYLFTTEKWGSDYSGGRLKGLMFYLNERIAFSILKLTGGSVVTASEFDRSELMRKEHFPSRKTLALRGGVDTKYFQSFPKQRIRYDAVFVGRFHPQKCVTELINIWHHVVTKDPTRVLALIGGGVLEEKLQVQVKRLNLTRNVLFLGVRDGEEKTKILKSSRIFVSASRFDSGNIALDEAMSCGLPGIIYDLPRLHYPRGVVKIPVDNEKRFVSAITTLLENEKKHATLSEEAQAFAFTIDWDAKAKEILTFFKRQI
jgi:glycosyltransferase involved in cell wall biosynthesis